MEGLVAWTVILHTFLVLALWRVIVSGERFVDRWLRIKEGRPYLEDVLKEDDPNVPNVDMRRFGELFQNDLADLLRKWKVLR